MINGIHTLWRGVERDARWAGLNPDQKLGILQKFAAGVRNKYGDVTGLTGLEQSVSDRITNPKDKEGFFESFVNQRSDDLVDQFGAFDAVKDKEKFRSTLDTLYELEVEHGAPERSFVGSLAGSLSSSVQEALPVATAGAAVGAAAGAGAGAPVFGAGAAPGAAAGAATGFGRGLITGMVAAEATKAFGRSLRDNYFSLLDKGMDSDAAFEKAYTAAGISAGITGIANAVSPVAAVERAAAGKTLGAVATKVVGEQAAASVNKRIAETAVIKGLDKGLRSAWAGGASTGAARFVRDSVLLAGADDIGFEAIDVAQERLQGLDTSERKGGLTERAGLAFVMGSAVRGLHGAAGKGFVGAKNVFEGRKFSDGLFDVENVKGLLGGYERALDAAESGIRSKPGAGYDAKDTAELVDVERARNGVRRMWDVLTNGTQPLDLKFADESASGADASLSRAAKTVTVFNSIFKWNGNDVKRLTLLHEAAHAHFDTLPPEVQTALRALYNAEAEHKSGPLHDENGNLRKNLSDDISSKNPEVAFLEWYAERTALVNDDWAKNKVNPQRGFWNTLASDFRVKAERIGRMLGFGDGFNNSFRDFLDAGDRYQSKGEYVPPQPAGQTGPRKVVGLLEAPKARDQQTVLSQEGVTKRESFAPILIGGDPINPSARVLTLDDLRSTGDGQILMPGDSGPVKPLVLPTKFMADMINKEVTFYTDAQVRQISADATLQDITARIARGQPREDALAPRQIQEAANLKTDLAERRRAEARAAAVKEAAPAPEPVVERVAPAPEPRIVDAPAPVARPSAPVEPELSPRLPKTMIPSEATTDSGRLLQAGDVVTFRPRLPNREGTRLYVAKHRSTAKVLGYTDTNRIRLEVTNDPSGKLGQTLDIERAGQSSSFHDGLSWVVPDKPVPSVVPPPVKADAPTSGALEAAQIALIKARREGASDQMLQRLRSQVDVERIKAETAAQSVPAVQERPAPAPVPEPKVEKKPRQAALGKRPRTADLYKLLEQIHDETKDKRERLRLRQDGVERVADDLHSRRGGKVEPEELQLLSDFDSINDADYLAAKKAAIADKLGGEGGSYTGEGFSEAMRRFTSNNPWAEVQVEMRNTRGNPVLVQRLIDKNTGRLVASMSAHVEGHENLYVSSVDTLSQDARDAAAIKRLRAQFGSMADAEKAAEAAYQQYPTISNRNELRRIIALQAVEDDVSYVNLDTSVGSALYSELATVGQAFNQTHVGGDIIGPGAIGVRTKVFAKNSFFDPDSRQNLTAAGAIRSLNSPKGGIIETVSKIDPDQLYSRRGTVALSDQPDMLKRNGWVLPDGSFLPTRPTDAIRLSGNGLVDELGNHAKAALSWLETNKTKEADRFWSEHEARAEAKGHDFDADGPPPIHDSDVYDFMKSVGWVRVAQGGNGAFIEGSPNSTQSRAIKDSAGLARITVTQDFGGRSRSFYDVEDVFSRRGGKGPASLPTRQFADRGADTHTELKDIRDRRPDIAFRQKPVDTEAERAKIAHATPADLEVAVKDLEDNFASREGNTLVLQGLALLERALALGDAALTERAYDVMAKAGTTLGQMLRQYREFKSVANKKNRLEIVKLALLREGRRMTPAQEAKVKGLIDADATAKADMDTALHDALAHPSDKAKMAKAKEAQYKENLAFRQMQAHVRSLMPRTVRQLPYDLRAMIQGNLLTPISTGRNAWGNYVFVVPRVAARFPAAIFDAARSRLTGTDRKVALPSIREAAWFMSGTASGFRKAKDAFLYGSNEDVIVGETIRGFNPGKALVEALTGDLPVDVKTGKVRWSDRIAKLAEGTFGAPPEMMLRSLSALDELAKDGFRAARAAEETKLRDAKPGTTEFASIQLLTDEAARHEAETTALQQTFQNKSAFAGAVQSIENVFASVPAVGGWLSLGWRVATSPYVRTPANLFVEAMKFGMPAFGFMHGFGKALQGKTREAELSMGYAVTGMVMGAAAHSLIEDGLVSAGPTGEKEDKVSQDSGMGFFRLNVSGLQRKLRGESSEYRIGDTTARLDTLGVFGFVLALRAEADRLNKSKPDQLPNPTAERLGLDQMGALIAGGRFAVQQTMLQGAADLIGALGDGGSERWSGNVANLVTSVALPNSVIAFRQTKENAIRRDLIAKGDSLKTIANVVQFKFGNADELPEKLDLWGRPVKATPEGQNPYVYQLLDIFKRETVRNDVSSRLYQLFEKTGDTDLIPTMVSRRVKVGHDEVNLTPELYVSRIKAVQGAKREMFEKMLTRPSWVARIDEKPEAAADALKAAMSAVGTGADVRWARQHRTELQELIKGVNDYRGRR